MNFISEWFRLYRHKANRGWGVQTSWRPWHPGNKPIADPRYSALDVTVKLGLRSLVCTIKVPTPITKEGHNV